MTKPIIITLHDYIPEPCDRPRLGKNGAVFSPSKEHQRNMAWMIRANLSHQKDIPLLPFEKPCAVCIQYFFGKNPFTNIQISPMDIDPFAPRGDIDNRDKFVLDALQKAGIYRNDSLVYQLNSQFLQA